MSGVNRIINSKLSTPAPKGNALKSALKSAFSPSAIAKTTAEKQQQRSIGGSPSSSAFPARVPVLSPKPYPLQQQQQQGPSPRRSLGQQGHVPVVPQRSLDLTSIKAVSTAEATAAALLQQPSMSMRPLGQNPVVWGEAHQDGIAALMASKAGPKPPPVAAASTALLGGAPGPTPPLLPSQSRTQQLMQTPPDLSMPPSVPQ